MANYTPVPQQGGAPYPRQGGYPAPNQAGYPAPQGQGYPAHSGQGYPPQGQGYQGQGYPAAIPQYKGKMPDPNDDPNPNLQKPTNPSAPPPEMLQSLPGYDFTGYDEAPAPPPAYEDVVKEPPARDPLPEFVKVTTDEAKGALQEYVSRHCCYGKGPAEKLNITDIQGSSAFHYRLESFCEGRTTKWESEPYKKGAICLTERPPAPWDVSVPSPELFKDSKMKLEVPNSSIVKPCNQCSARGYKECYKCHGRGKCQCTFCNGSGRKSHGERCVTCEGKGQKTCHSCYGSGEKECRDCKGAGHLRWFIKLTVRWHNHNDDHIVERTSLPPKLIKDVAGTTVLQETSLRVFPINHFPDQEINQASNELVNEHATKFNTERMLQQRHNLRIVPVNSVSYRLDVKTGTFFVYGTENKVYFPDYPASCCWGCNIL